ncbi:MAG: reverse transcriptase N-terminal domain-containing protein [Candidatus Methanomethylophilaceae archaeon]
MASVCEPSERVVRKAGGYRDGIVRTDAVQGRDEGMESPESDGQISPGLWTAPKAQASPHRNPVSPTDPGDGGSIAREAIVRRVEDGAGSECLPVTGRIGTLCRPEREPICPRSDAAVNGWEPDVGVHADTRCCAADVSDGFAPKGWCSIDWERAESDIRGIQSRIAKAARNGNTARVRMLQDMLLTSYHGRCMAVRTVITGPWGDVPGEDGEVWSTPEAMGRAAETLDALTFVSGQTVRRPCHRGAGGGEVRLPTMHDRAVQELHAMALRPVMEVCADPHSFGFREGRGVRDAVESLRGILRDSGPDAMVMVMRIGSMDDGTVWRWLSDNRGVDSRMLGQLVRGRQLFGRSMFPHTPGTVDLGGISPVLANMALDGMEGMLSMNGVRMVRYADMVAAVVDGSIPSAAVSEASSIFLVGRGLCILGSETPSLEDGFDFLGFAFRRSHGRMTVQPSDGSVDAVCSEIKRIAAYSAASTQGDLIRRVNRAIREWCGYYTSVPHRTASRHVDHSVHLIIRRWATRRHPQKGATWIRDRYWHDSGSGRVFTDGESTLITASGIGHRPHTPVRTWSDPYSDPWYFREREGMTTGASEKEWTMFGLPSATAPRNGVASGPSRMR